MAQFSLSTVYKDPQGTISSAVCKFGESKAAIAVFMYNKFSNSTVIRFVSVFGYNNFVCVCSVIIAVCTGFSIAYLSNPYFKIVTKINITRFWGA